MLNNCGEMLYFVT